MKVSQYDEELSALPEGFLFMSVLQPDGTYKTKKIVPSKVGAQGPTGPQGPGGFGGGGAFLSGVGPPTSDTGNVGDGYFDTSNADCYAKLSVGWVLINSRGQGIVTAAEFGLVGGAGNDESNNISAIFAYLEAMGDIPMRVVIRSRNGSDPIQINKTLTMDRSNTVLDFHASPILYGPLGSIRILGSQTETTRNGKLKAKLRANAGVGTSLLQLSTNSEVMQASDFAVGDILVIRGENDINGKALTKQVVHVLSRDLGLNNLTLSEELEYSFDVTYPSSDWTPSGSTDGTTLALLASAALTVDATSQSDSITVNTAQLISSGIEAGDVVLLSTNETEYDRDNHAHGVSETQNGATHSNASVTGLTNTALLTVGWAVAGTGIPLGTKIQSIDSPTTLTLTASATATATVSLDFGAPYLNTARIEVKRIISANTSTGKVIFDSPIIDGYAVTKYASIVLLNPVIHSVITGVRGTFSADQASRNVHPIQLGYSYLCRVEDCHVNGSNGQYGNGIRVSNSLDCQVEKCRVTDPKFVGSGEGYGFTVYYSDRTKIVNCVGEGCRHNFLCQKANHTQFLGCDSINDSISGFDVHGVFSFHTIFESCRVFGGANYRAGVANKSGFRIGNTSHSNGDWYTEVRNCKVYGCSAPNLSSQLTYTGLEMFASSDGLIVQGCYFIDCSRGIRIGNNANSDDLWNRTILIDGNVFQNITTMFDIDGDSTQKDVRDIIVSNNVSIGNTNHFVFKYCVNLKVMGNRVLRPLIAGGEYAYDFNRCDNLTVVNNEAYGTARGIKLNTCTNVVQGNNRFSVLFDGVTFLESGTSTYVNTGGLIRVNQNVAYIEEPVTCDITTDEITRAAHNLVNGNAVRFTGTLPTGLASGTVYYVVSASTNTFQVSATVGGGAIDLTVSNGSAVLVSRVVNAVTAVGTTAPTTSEGDLIISTAYTSNQPGREVKLTFVIPYGSISVADNVIVHLFVGSTPVGSFVSRPATTGATSGIGITCHGSYLGDGTSQTITARIGVKTSGTTFMTGDRFTSAASRPGKPYLLIEDVP